jgi:hypothetical protein
MKERPVLFSAPMVRALLDGSKTQTRRSVKPHPSDDEFCLVDHGDGWWPHRSNDGESPNVDGMEYPMNCPHGSAGDRLWVRETHRPIFGQTCGLLAVDYRADAREKWERLGDAPDSLLKPTKWIPSIHMRREYSRILLEVVSVRVERLNDCSEVDAIAEGINRTDDGDAWNVEDETHRATSPVDSYASLWEAINGAGSWAANPWVWVIEFKRFTA